MSGAECLIMVSEASCIGTTGARHHQLARPSDGTAFTDLDGSRPQRPLWPIAGDGIGPV